jgi:5-methyltetrahydrofolate--homocysteine methyltransferase
MPFAEIAEAVIEGRDQDTSRLVRAALDRGVDAKQILEQGLIAGMRVVGVRFRENEIFVPEVLVSARAMKAGMTHLEAVFTDEGVPTAGTFLIGTVKGDIHDVGKNLVAMMLRGAGFKVVDLGVNVGTDKFLAAIGEHQPEIVGMSALLTTTMVQMKVNIDAFRAAGLDVSVMIGGAPVTAEYAERIGADGYSPNATEAVERALAFMGARRRA